jgi:hypothetical protein
MRLSPSRASDMFYGAAYFSKLIVDNLDNHEYGCLD